MGVPCSSVGSAADRLSLASKRCVYDPRSKLKLCYAVHLHRKDVCPSTCALSLAMNTLHNNPIVSQRTCPVAGYARHNNPILSQRACHWEDHPSSSSSSS